MKIIKVSLFLLVFLFTNNFATAQGLPPDPIQMCVKWRNFSWLDREYYYPNAPVNQRNSDYDWWYDHCTAYNITGGIDGYIACGVSKYRADRNTLNPPIAYDERFLGGCAYGQAPLYDPSGKCTDYDHGNHENCVSGQLGLGFNTIGRVSNTGQTDYLFTMNYEGEYYRVKQLSDGTFLTVGHSLATRKRQQAPQNGSPLMYNPSSVFGMNNHFDYADVFNLSNNPLHKNKAHWDVMKFDITGTCLFNNIYGQEKFSTTPNNLTWGTTLTNLTGTQKSYMSNGMANDFVENPTDGVIAIVGQQEIDENKPKAAIIQIDKHGTLLNKQFLDLSTDDKNSVARAIALVPNPSTTGTPYYLVAITKSDASLYGRAIVELYALDYNLSNSVKIKEFNTVNISKPSHSSYTVWNMVVKNGFVYIPMIQECNNVWYSGDHDGNLYAYKISIPSTMPTSIYTPTIISRKITPIYAFDIKARITSLTNGNLAIVSTVRYYKWSAIHPTVLSLVPPHILSCITATGPNCYNNSSSASIETTDYWNTDAYVTEILSSNLNSVWSMRFSSDDIGPNLVNSSTGFRTATYGGDDPKHQECMYGISEGPNGSIIVSGNSSGNVDDCYMVKINRCPPIKDPPD